MKRFPRELLILAAAFVFVNLWTLKDGHNWGGDFSQYIRHAQNIIEHRPYAWSYDLEPKVISSPGFPLLLTPFLKVFGVNFKILKGINVFIWLFFVMYLYLLSRRYLTPTLSLLMAAFFLSSPEFFCFKQNVLSDLPFLLFTTAALYYWVEYFEYSQEYSVQQQKRLLLQAVFFMAYAFLIRWAGIFLFLSTIIYVVVCRKEKKLFWAIGSGLLLPILIQQYFGASWAYHLQEHKVPFAKASEAVFYNFPQTFKAALVILFPIKTKLSVALFAFFKPIIIVLAPMILLLLLISFLRSIGAKRVDFLMCFSMAYLCAVLSWYVMGGQSRYLLPLWGPLMILGVRKLIKWTEHIKQKTILKQLNGEIVAGCFFSFMLFYNVVSVTLVFDFDDDDIYQPEVQQMVVWVKGHMDPQAHVMFREPRVLGLLTDRRGVGFLNYFEPPDLNERLHRFAVKYIIVEKTAFRFRDQRFNSEMFSFYQLANEDPALEVVGTEQMLTNIDAQHFILQEVWANNKFRVLQVTGRNG